MSALLQQVDMFADIAVLPPVSDMWSLFGAQNEPFPGLMYPTWATLVWESIHQNGNACDYVSEEVIREAGMKDGWMYYGPRKYHTIFLIRVERMEPATVRKLYDFVVAGGRIFCIETMPDRSVGLNDHVRRDAEVQSWVSKMKAFPERFILLTKPEKNWILWYKDVQQKYGITPYVHIDNPDPFVTQVRYQSGKTEMLLFINSSTEKEHRMNLDIHKDIASGRQAWVWDAVTGERWHIGSGTSQVGSGSIQVGSGALQIALLPNRGCWCSTGRRRGWRGSRRLWLVFPVEGFLSTAPGRRSSGISMGVCGRWSCLS